MLLKFFSPDSLSGKGDPAGKYRLGATRPTGVRLLHRQSCLRPNAWWWNGRAFFPHPKPIFQHITNKAPGRRPADPRSAPLFHFVSTFILLDKMSRVGEKQRLHPFSPSLPLLVFTPFARMSSSETVQNSVFAPRRKDAKI